MRVLVTRPQAESETLAAALTERGHAAIVAPVVTILPLPVSLPARRVDAVLATSPQATAALDVAVRDRLRLLPLYVVGSASATVARRTGFTDVRIGAGDGAALADLVLLTCPRGSHLLRLAGRVRKGDLTIALEDRGFAVSTVETYDARAVDGWSETVRRVAGTAGFDACLHFSRRSAELALAGSRAGPIASFFDHAAHHCLSADVAAPLEAARLAKITVADHPTASSLLQGLARRMSHSANVA